MSTCSNCYNGCTEIVSDRCVKYTGINVPILGIQTGDSLSYVEQALITFLTSTLDGTGVIINLDDIDICQVVNKYLPTCKDLSIVDISKALIQAACDLQEQVDIIVAELAELNADYTIGCLTGVTPSSNTHAIVQAVINKVCQLEVDLDLLALDLETNYVKGSELDALIQNYLDSVNFLALAKDRMIPYSPIPYFGGLSNYPSTGDSFDINGAGSGYWDNIYLCNGLNGTPDLRGRTLVGVTTGMGGGTFNPAVNPLIPGNPNYTLFSTTGANQISLSISEMPDHTHTATVSTVPDHTHYMAVAGSVTTNNNNSLYNGTAANRNELGLTSRAFNQDVSDNYDYELTSSAGDIDAGKTSEAGGHTHTVTVGNRGGGNPHSNVQPSIGCYYIMYIP
jgi:microcystin-dependent protein